MTNIRAIEACNVSPVSFTWENEENAKQDFFRMMEETRKVMASDLHNEGVYNMEMMDSGIDEIDFAAPERVVTQDQEGDIEEDFEGETEEDYNPFNDIDEGDKEEVEEEETEEDIDMSNGQNDPLAPYADEMLNICFKGYGGVQIDFVQRLGREAHKAVDVLFAQQKGKFNLTIQRIVETDNGTEYVDIMTKYPAVGQKSKIKGAGASAGTSTKGKTPEQLAEIERKRKEAEEERKRKEAEKAAKAEMRAKAKAAEELQAAMKAARNAPDEFHKDGSANKSYLVFEMLHRAQGATYHELGDATATVNGGWKTTIRKFASAYNKAVLTMYRTCEAKGGIKPYAAYKLIDNNGEALGSIPNGWVIDPSV